MPKPQLDTRQIAKNTLLLVLSGEWKTGQPVPSAGELFGSQVEGRVIRTINFDSQDLVGWDTSLVGFVHQLSSHCAPVDIEVVPSGLPGGARRLLKLAAAVPPMTDADKTVAKLSFLGRIGEAGLAAYRATLDTLEFIGDLALSFKRLLGGKARFRKADILEVIQECGWKALPIVSLISILIGLILAFVGAVQLSLFGAQIYIADLVGIGIAREMGAIMTGIIMAGRTGAAFAANIGTMQVNEEVDALQTLGVSPMDFLVLPRILALLLMMPLLTVYSDLLGILGGLVVGVGTTDISLIQYLEQTRNALTLTHFSVGLVKSIFFGLIVGLAGCMQGLRCGRSAAAVGQATTSAVVIAIVGIVVADGLFAVLTNVLGV
jgi:phospholipid/cholesterol/gamma-HCH transport system permease protein